MKHLRFARLPLALCLCLLFAPLAVRAGDTPPSSPYWANDGRVRLIAHGGGSYKGCRTPNSAEALRANLPRYRHVELDLHATADGRLLAAHALHDLGAMRHCRRQKGPLGTLDAILRGVFGICPRLPSHALGMGVALSNGQTPLDDAAIAAAFARQDDAVLVTDKCRRFDLLARFFPFADRLLVEVFSPEDHDRALRAGIRHPMLCIWTPDELHALDSRLRPDDIAMITAPAELVRQQPDAFRRLYARGVNILAFTVNEPDFLATFNDCVTAVYTDTLLPDAAH